MHDHICQYFRMPDLSETAVLCKLKFCSAVNDCNASDQIKSCEFFNIIKCSESHGIPCDFQDLWLSVGDKYDCKNMGLLGNSKSEI